jgi:hypothetical protein
MTDIQKLVKGKPKSFAKTIGCPVSTANQYSAGTREPAKWVIELIKLKLNHKHRDI